MCQHRIGVVSHGLLCDCDLGQEAEEDNAPTQTSSQRPRNVESGVGRGNRWRRPLDVLMVANLSHKSSNQYRGLIVCKKEVECRGRGHCDYLGITVERAGLRKLGRFVLDVTMG